MGNALSLAFALVLAAGPARAAAPLSEAETGIAKLRLLAAEVERAFAAPLAVSGSPDLAALGAKLEAECRRGFKIDALLTPEEFGVYGDRAIAHLSCKAAAAKSLEPCDRLAVIDAAIAKGTVSRYVCGENERCQMRAMCARHAGTHILVEALIRKPNAAACALGAEMFNELPPAQRAAPCRAIFSSGVPEQACANMSAALGGGVTPPEAANCRALIGLRGAASARACADKNLWGHIAGACNAVFEASTGPACASSAASLAGDYCKDVAARQAAAAGQKAGGHARIQALDAFRKKHDEVRGALARAASTESQDPRYSAARAAAAALEKAVKAAASR